MTDKKTIKITIPDGTPEKQIKQIEDLKEVMLTMGKLTGEEVDVKPFDEAIAKLKANE